LKNQPTPKMKKLFTVCCLLLAILFLHTPKLTAATLIDEDFESWPPANWQTFNYGGAGVWTNHNAIHAWHNYINIDKPISEQGDVAVADADYFDAEIDTALITPPLDLTDHSYIVLPTLFYITKLFTMTLGFWMIMPM